WRRCSPAQARPAVSPSESAASFSSAGPYRDRWPPTASARACACHASSATSPAPRAWASACRAASTSAVASIAHSPFPFRAAPRRPEPLSGPAGGPSPPACAAVDDHPACGQTAHPCG
ncbi:DUF2242 domain-containing protein, partial [Streptomyces sp. DJ]